MTFPINNPNIRAFTKQTYDQQSLDRIWNFLQEKEALKFTALETHLYPAAAAEDAQKTGYQYVWVRDNVYVAYAHDVMGRYQEAAATVSALMSYFKKIRARFENIITHPDRSHQVMQRPHIRFDGRDLSELDEEWEHAQNDSLGYFLWFYCRLVSSDRTRGFVQLGQEEYEMLALFVLYFKTIEYWTDCDSGHWEEVRKISASSIGTVVAGLKELQSLHRQNHINLETWTYCHQSSYPRIVDQLITEGQQALDHILPWESREPIEHARQYDSALLFLIYPLGVVSDSQAEGILQGVSDRLTGSYGIQRYPDDSFWCRDFQDLDKSIQTAKYTQRQAWLKENGRSVQRGEEAQWCIFDSVLSALYGQRFQNTRDLHDLERQTHHFNRALGQITGYEQRVISHQGHEEIVVEIPPCRCPELYYLQGDRYSPNVSTPLLWAQANLCIAFAMMQQSIEGR